MAQALQPVRGTHDILPEEARKRQALNLLIRGWVERYGFGEIRTPVFEFSEVFLRTLGDTSDVVTKETYTFADRGGESLTLRPEFTASVVRAFLSGGLQNELPCKFFYYGPAFRYERPQKGRLRQFHQYGVELLGVAEPDADIEVIALASDIIAALGLQGSVELQLNSLGDAESRTRYRAALVGFLEEHKASLSVESQARLEKNPLRVLDSKDEGDRKIIARAPGLQDYFTPEATAFFARVQAGLSALGIAFTLNAQLVRGLDYYNHTVFEFVSTQLGAQNTLIAGGRFDGLVQQMGGPSVPGVGFGAGEERLLLSGLNWEKIPGWGIPDIIAIVPIGEQAEAESLKLAHYLRSAGFVVDVSYRGNTGKRMKRADKIGAKFALMIGEDELRQGVVTCKNLKTGGQQGVARDALIEYLRTVL